MTARRADLVTVVAVAVIVVGCCARFVHLDRLWYFHDEAITSLRLSGETGASFRSHVAGRTVSVADLDRYQTAHGSPLATVRSLALEDPQHPPLFFVAERGFASVAGSSATALRALAAIFGVLAVVGAAALARELFGSWRTGAVAGAAVAISPFQLLYSQQAREYSLWVATTALASWALVRMLRKPTMSRYALYGLALALALYTFPNTLLVLAAHLLVVLGSSEGRRAKKGFVVAAAGALAAFVPWLVVMAVERGALDAGTSWITQAVPLSELARSWLIVTGLDVADHAGSTSTYGAYAALVFASVLSLHVAALIVVALRAARDAALLVIALVLVPFVPLALLDVAAGGIRSAIPRYIAPTYLAFSVALAYLVCAGLAANAAATRASGAVMAAALVTAAVVSYTHRWDARIWWNADDGAAAANLAAAREVRQRFPHRLDSAGVGTLLELSHALPADTRIRVALDGAAPTPRGGAVVVYGSPANGAAAARLEILLATFRKRGVSLRELVPSLACCGAGIKPIPHQLWLASTKP